MPREEVSISDPVEEKEQLFDELANLHQRQAEIYQRIDQILKEPLRPSSTTAWTNQAEVQQPEIEALREKLKDVETDLAQRDFELRLSRRKLDVLGQRSWWQRLWNK